jgi:hypothetical protein
MYAKYVFSCLILLPLHHIRSHKVNETRVKSRQNLSFPMSLYRKLIHWQSFLQQLSQLLYVFSDEEGGDRWMHL